MRLDFIKYSGLLILLFIIIPFIQSDTSESLLVDSISSVPPIISQISGYLRWGLFIFFCIATFINKDYLLNFQFNHISIILFFFIPFTYSLVTFSDTVRYFSLLIFITLLPIYISSQLGKVDINKFFKILSIAVYVVFCISLVIGMKGILHGFRFYGSLNNPNLYSVIATFWIAILLINNDQLPLKRINIVVAILIFITIILSGSRSGFVASICLFFITFMKSTKYIVVIGLTILLLLFLLAQFIDISFMMDRFMSVSDAAANSGRKEVWDKAINYIQMDKWGYGMNAPTELLGTGNVHNCYVRFLFTMGIFFGCLTILFYVIFVISTFFKKNVPNSLIGFLIGYALANYGEDFFVGIGSAVFICFSFVLGLIYYFQLNNEKNYLVHI